MENKTIKQLADELGVSKTAVRNCMDDAFRAKYTAKNSKGEITISAEGCKVVSEKYRKSPQSSENQLPKTGENQVSGDMVALLQATIETLREQLAVKDRQIEHLTRLADQAQALHAGTIKQALPEGGVEIAAAAEPAPAAAEPEQPKSFWRRIWGG
jgi:predicted ArsR family transcriptional regulator